MKPGASQRWTAYALSLALFNLFGCLLLFAILSFQNLLPLNPQGFDGLSWHLAFNTAVSFHDEHQLAELRRRNDHVALQPDGRVDGTELLSAATGIAVAVAVTRGIAARSTQAVGDFWTDLIRSILYLLLPGSILLALVLIWQGMPQTLAASLMRRRSRGAKQTIPVGPVASQVAIKMLGTNGGGFFNVNAAHPFENRPASQTSCRSTHS